MKTSNKLLLVFALAAFLSTASVMLYAKSQMISKDEYQKELKLSGEFIERELTENFTTEEIEMGDNFQWVIDPNSTKVVVSGDETLVSKLEVSDSKRYRLRTGGVDYSMVDYDMVTVTVGIKNLKEIKIEGNGNAYISATSPIDLEFIDLRMNGNARCKLDATSPEMNVSSNGNGKLTLNGQAQAINAHINGNGRIYAEDFSVKNVEVRVSGNGKFYGGEVESITGNGSGNATIEVKEASQKNRVSTSGNARFTINR